MIERRFLLLPILLAFMLPAARAGTADTTPEAWLERMNHALRALNYRGTFVYMRADHVETMQVIHRGDSRGGIERIVSLTGPKREIVRDHKEVKCISPVTHSVLVERRFATAARLGTGVPASVDTAALADYYRFKNLSEDRVAGIRTHVISIQPRDAYRYGYRLWLDAHTGMLMRSDLLDEDGQLVERVVFTSLAYPRSIPDADLQPTEIGRDYVWNIQGDSDQPLPEEAHVSWQVGELPPGFKLSLSDVQRVAGVAHPVRHFVFSDGLASVSVFAELATLGRKVLLGPSRMGAVNAYGRSVGGRHLTVVGEAPAATVEKIARAMRLQPR
ncbi:MAG TPA: MucB/RseB C-terminal domain-containing protein [Gammaproteobacteria bacterium]|nr:MucB/RseB C-terminal domain-containing protein [Gammaproteobacteria bacterium]